MSRRRRLLRITAANLCFVVGLWLVETFVAERHWLTTLITYSPQHWIGVPSVVLIVWALVRRAWLPAALTLAALCIFVLGPLGFEMRGARSHHNGTPVRVMTWNIHHGSGGVDGIMAVVREIHPDIVCFQESNRGHWRNPALPELRKAFKGWHYAGYREWATFSRYPIVIGRKRRLWPHWARVTLETVVDIDGRQLTVYSMHLSTSVEGRSLRSSGLRGLPSYLEHTTQTRMNQVLDLEKVTRTATSPSIVVGDFNTPPRGLCYRRMTRHYRDAFASQGSGLGYTYPVRWPAMRIDYILAEDAVGVVRCFVPETNASDHRPVVADLVLPREEGW